MTDFDTALQSFVAGCEAITGGHRAKHYPNLPADSFSTRPGKRYVKVVRDGGAHCFVEIATGDVLMAASWSKPAKHARGNIFDEHNGLGSMGPYGPAYLR